MSGFDKEQAMTLIDLWIVEMVMLVNNDLFTDMIKEIIERNNRIVKGN